MKYKSTATDSKNKGTGFLLLSIMAAGGILFGAFFVSHGHSAAYPLIHQYLAPAENGKSFFRIFVHTFGSSAMFLLAAAISGFSAVGQPIASALLVYRGFGIGAASAAVYSASGFGAAVPAIIASFPRTAALLIVSVLAVRESIRSSFGIMYYLAKGEAVDRHTNELKLYFIRFAVLFFISAVISIGDAVFSIAL